jgi:hypothetical protein
MTSRFVKIKPLAGPRTDTKIFIKIYPPNALRIKKLSLKPSVKRTENLLDIYSAINKEATSNGRKAMHAEMTGLMPLKYHTSIDNPHTADRKQAKSILNIETDLAHSISKDIVGQALLYLSKRIRSEDSVCISIYAFLVNIATIVLIKFVLVFI